MMLFYVTYVAKATARVLGITSEKRRSQQLNLIMLYENIYLYIFGKPEFNLRMLQKNHSFQNRIVTFF